MKRCVRLSRTLTAARGQTPLNGSEPSHLFPRGERPTLLEPAGHLRTLSPGLPPATLYRCCSAAKLCLTLCDFVICSTPGFSVLRHHSNLAQTHVHRVGDAIQPSHPLSLPSPPALNLLRSYNGSGPARHSDCIDLLTVTTQGRRRYELLWFMRNPALLKDLAATSGDPESRHKSVRSQSQRILTLFTWTSETGGKFYFLERFFMKDFFMFT